MSPSLLYLDGNAAAGAEECDRSVTPVWVYLGAFLLLVGGTVTGFVAALLPLGPTSLAVAMATAVIQTSLAAGLLMHLHSQSRVYAFLLACSLLLVGAMWCFPLFDLEQSGAVVDESGVEWKGDVDRRGSKARARIEARAATAGP